MQEFVQILENIGNASGVLVARRFCTWNNASQTCFTGVPHSVDSFGVALYGVSGMCV